MLCRYFVLFFRDLVFDLLQEGVILLGLFRCLYITICSRITEKIFSDGSEESVTRRFI